MDYKEINKSFMCVNISKIKGPGKLVPRMLETNAVGSVICGHWNLHLNFKLSS